MPLTGAAGPGFVDTRCRRRGPFARTYRCQVPREAVGSDVLEEVCHSEMKAASLGDPGAPGSAAANRHRGRRSCRPSRTLQPQDIFPDLHYLRQPLPGGGRRTRIASRHRCGWPVHPGLEPLFQRPCADDEAVYSRLSDDSRNCVEGALLGQRERLGALRHRRAAAASAPGPAVPVHRDPPRLSGGALGRSCP